MRIGWIETTFFFIYDVLMDFFLKPLFGQFASATKTKIWHFQISNWSDNTQTT